VPDDRDRLLEQLQAKGDRRREVQSAEREVLDEIAALLPAALSAGISKREIARRTGLSRPWIDHLLEGEDTSD
jgi:transcriptional regulator with XRE-family HTH domain